MIAHPTFLIIGAQKCGTTSMYHYLKQHPDIFMPDEKELHYFDRRYRHKPVSWYKEKFEEARAYKASGEATPLYCIYPGALERIHSFNSEIKLIMLLRNPVDRAISHYSMEVARGREDLPLLEALDKETLRIDNLIKFPIHSYFKRGRYHLQYDEIFKHFSKKQILTCRLENIQIAPQVEMDRITKFLRVSKFELSSYPKHFSGSYDPVDSKVRDILENYYLEDNELLFSKYGILV